MSKKLLIEPALPRFVREGDEVRAEGRRAAEGGRKREDSCALHKREEGSELLGDPRQELLAKRETPAVVSFRARARSTGVASVRFDRDFLIEAWGLR